MLGEGWDPEPGALGSVCAHEEYKPGPRVASYGDITGHSHPLQSGLG